MRVFAHSLRWSRPCSRLVPLLPICYTPDIHTFQTQQTQVQTSLRSMSMPFWVQILMIIAVISLTIIVSEWCSCRAQQRRCAHESGELFGLKEGQTIMAVVDAKEALYFCIGKGREKQ